jgi:hypothetical protein
MKLTTDLLPEYFTIAGPHNSHYTTPTNCFNFKDRGSDCLVVTIGDSWTWGADLDPVLRTQQVYGNLVSQELNADWLNLAQSGSNNFFIAERVEELAKIAPSLGYKKIKLICTFTEIGRSFNSHHDVYIDYVSWFQHNHIEQFLSFLNAECVNRIKKAAMNFELRLSTNFIDAIGFDPDLQPWFRVLDIPCKINAYCGSTGVNKLQEVEQFVPNKVDYQNWMINLIDQSQHIDKVCQSPTLISTHPKADGHQAWANYILKTL